MLIFNVEFPSADLLMKEIIRFAETQAVTSNILKEYAITRLLCDENVLSQVCQEKTEVGNSLKKIALQDIEELMGNLKGVYMLQNYLPSRKRQLSFPQYQQSLEGIVASNTYGEMLEGIIAHYTRFGSGETGKYIAFKWNEGLQGIGIHDDITLDNLFCVDRQKQQLVDNTVAFLQGFSANNVLLYGHSGCGKSSMVKALLNQYYSDGLRLVQMAKEQLNDLPVLMEVLRNKHNHYIIFLDDLSFEGDELNYKPLKTILEGGIEKQPENVLFYATSNRFHLVNETWSQRQGDDIHTNDTQNERLSLSKRFGIRISFLSPSQEEYLQIIEGILSQNGIAVTEDIRKEALRWAMHYNGRSGRTASQFISTLPSQQTKDKL